MSVQSAAQHRIHEAAIRLFSERGSSQITVQELAKHAGVARGSIYNNVDSIEALFQSIPGGEECMAVGNRSASAAHGVREGRLAAHALPRAVELPKQDVGGACVPRSSETGRR